MTPVEYGRSLRDAERKQRVAEQARRIEPRWDTDTGNPYGLNTLREDRAMESIAISLKRIADSLEQAFGPGSGQRG